MAIAGLVVVGRSSSVDDEIRLDLATSEVAGALRFARSEAIRTGRHHGARIESTQQRIRVYQLDVSGSPAVEEYVVAHPVDKHPFQERWFPGGLRHAFPPKRSLILSKSACARS